MGFPCAAIVMKFLSLCSVPRASLSILLYLYSVSVKLLLANAIGCRILLSDTVCFWHVVPSHVCSGAAARPTPELSVSK